MWDEGGRDGACFVDMTGRYPDWLLHIARIQQDFHEVFEAAWPTSEGKENEAGATQSGTAVPTQTTDTKCIPLHTAAKIRSGDSAATGGTPSESANLFLLQAS